MTPTVESTYKAKEVEERIDILFYRPLGFRVAKLASGIGLSPNVITIVSIIFGMLGGHLFYYDDLRLTIAGMILWVCSNILDSADGQLARMTGQTSEIGRLLDGLGGGVVFGSIYLHIALRHIDDGGMFGVWVIAIALFAGISHAIQSSLADYYRNAFLRYGPPAQSGEIGNLPALRERYQQLSWRIEPIAKFFTRVYINYASQQEFFAGDLLPLRDAIETKFAGDPPPAFRAEYGRLRQPLLKVHNYLTINGRILTLFLFVLAGFGAWFFVFEIVILNGLFFALLSAENRRSRCLLQGLDQREFDLQPIKTREGV